jgi:membrane peptidoglycan carboxypeptidase
VSGKRDSARKTISGFRGVIGVSAIVGIIATIIAVPVLAVSSAAASGAIDSFDDLPATFEIGTQPQQNRLIAYRDDEPVTIAYVYSQNRQEIGWDEVTPALKGAVLAAEDHRFYEHGAIDMQAIVRAGIATVTTGDTQGGSTLTQQLVKNICIAEAFKDYPNQGQDDEELAKYREAVQACAAVAIDRKIREMKYAIALEKEYTKDEILLGYLNIANYGGTIYGIQSAAERYFDTDADDLTIAQAASLVATVQTPSALRLDIEENYPANTARRDTVINNMYTYGYITAAERDEALATVVGSGVPKKKASNPETYDGLKITEPRNGCSAANKYAKQFCDYVVKNVGNLEALGADADERERNWRIGGYTLYTTLDLKLQQVAQDAVRQWAPADETALELGSASTSVEAGTGEILTMAQNKAFDDTGTGGKDTTAVNFATDKQYGGSSGFQPGSTYKVFTLLNWLESGHGLNEWVYGSARTVDQTEFLDTCLPKKGDHPYVGPFEFGNDSGEAGSFSVREATARSINGAFVSMAEQLDLCRTKQIAEAFGMHQANGDEMTSNPANVLGVNEVAPLSIAAAFAGIANNGEYCTPIAVTKIVTTTGEELPGQTSECSQAIAEPVAIAAQSALQGAIANYPSNPYDGTDLIGKTGTTDDSVQTWATGASTRVASTTWFGNIRGFFPIRSYAGYTGGNYRHYIQKAILTEMDIRYPGGEFEEPDSSFLLGSATPVGNYIGMTENAARSAIQGDGFAVGNVGTVSSELPEGQVARQTPGSGSPLSDGAPVQLWLSDGSLTSVPDVTGTDLGTAQVRLSNQGFTNVREVCVQSDSTPSVPGDPLSSPIPNIPDGTIVGMTPDAGEVVNLGKRVTLKVSYLVCP